MLAWFKFQAKIPNCSGVCVQGERQKHTPSFPTLSKVEGLRVIGHSMSIGNLILGVSSVTFSYLIHYNSLLQNATDTITKSDSYFITKCDRNLLQNASGFLLQNAKFSTNCDNTNLFFRKIFLSLVRYIIALFKSLSIYGSWFSVMYLFLKGHVYLKLLRRC